MTFVWPQLLWLLLLVPLLVALYVWLLARRKKVSVQYSNLALVKQALGKQPAWRRHIPPALMLIALGGMLFAAARPMMTIQLPSNKQTIMLAMDVSGSMRAKDVEPTRLVAAQTAAKAFLAELPRHVRVGIVAFAGSAQLAQLPTLSREDLNTAIDSFQLQRGTATGNGIALSLATLFPDDGIDISQMHGAARGRCRARDRLANRRRTTRNAIPSRRAAIPAPQSSCSPTVRAPPAPTRWKPPRWPPTAASASTRWASAPPAARSSASKAGACACGWTTKR
ncbi:MAG: VWA domain-containing protein [Aquincola sp.]|nr:VWA domain-containing protein [Aquincola sp.]